MYCKTINSTVNPRQIAPGAVVLIEEYAYTECSYTMADLLDKPETQTYRAKLTVDKGDTDFLVTNPGKWALDPDFDPAYICTSDNTFIGRIIRVISTPGKHTP